MALVGNFLSYSGKRGEGFAMLMALTLVMAMGTQARAATCPAEKFGQAVDQSGASLRAFNAEAQPKLNERIKALKIKKGWPEEGYEEQAYDFLQDDHIVTFDKRSNDLLSKIDSLGQQGEKGGADCATLDELRAAGAELLGVMKAKSSYMLERIDSEAGPAVAAVAPPSNAEPPMAKTEAPAKAPAAPSATPAPAQPKNSSQPDASWSAKTTAVTPVPLPPSEPKLTPPTDAYVAPPVAQLPSQDGYTVEEIRDATRGFFGTISTNLATVLEHTFSIAGKPTGYVLGQEGGGAFLAGLRYGDGTLYMRTGATQRVYWHGPTIGADLGAAGSRTLFLIYKLTDPADLYRSFTGLDGSAYLVGGVGVTLMKGGKVIMAPIRSGLGLRLGANIGYVRFTDHPTWNPF